MWFTTFFPVFSCSKCWWVTFGHETLVKHVSKRFAFVQLLPLITLLKFIQWPSPHVTEHTRSSLRQGYIPSQSLHSFSLQGVFDGHFWWWASVISFWHFAAESSGVGSHNICFDNIMHNFGKNSFSISFTLTTGWFLFSTSAIFSRSPSMYCPNSRIIKRRCRSTIPLSRVSNC